LNEEAFAVIRASSGKTAAGRLLLGAGVLALLIPAIAGCEAGSDAPTLEFHAASFGAQTVFNGIQIVNAFVLGAPVGSTVPPGSSAGMFVSFYNNNNSADTLLSVKAAGTAPTISVPGGAVALPANAAPVNLTGPQPKVVLENLTTTLTGGSNIPVTFTFAHAGSVTLEVPVEAQAFQWATFSPPAATPSASASPSGSATPSTSGSATPSGTGSASPSTSASATPSTSASATQ
jgi:copper(I)-binding protein